MEQQVIKSDFKQDVMEHLEQIRSRIYEIRGVRVMLDFDLAELYQVETRVLKQAVRRNLERFPEDFMFQLSKEEVPEDFFKVAICDFKNSSGISPS